MISENNNILQAVNITKRFADAEVIKNISFTMDRQEVLVIMGASGSGKTTLLRCLNSLEKPDAGDFVVKGNIGLVFQSFNLFPQYTAFKNIVLSRELAAKKLPDYKKNKKSIIEEIHREGRLLLEQTGLADKSGFYPHQLSGGQQQRVAIARALALKPDILCLDEPTSALDPGTSCEVQNVIRALADKRMAMIIVTHRMEFARQIADKILFLDEGSVISYGTPQQVLDNPSNEKIKRFLY
jgi:polar amino acid transport system ATP-binding protein